MGTCYTLENPRTAKILRLREEGHTYQSIAKEVGISRERVRQIIVITRRRIANAAP